MLISCNLIDVVHEVDAGKARQGLGGVVTRQKRGCWEKVCIPTYDEKW
jgi:hypothetical protein